ncbi:MAG: DUF2027 domain-containing protein [Marinifilaceae bacterium]
MARIGDIVRFITEKLEGKVTSIVNKEIVNVYVDEYGFEIPAHITDLVVVKTDFKEDNNAKASTNNQKSVEVESTGKVFLAMTPSNMNNLLNAQFDFSIVNDTPYTILYTVSATRENGKVAGLSAGNCNSDDKVLIDSFSIKQIDNQIKSLTVQVLYYSKGEYTLRTPSSVTLKISSVNLCKGGNYKHNRWFKELSYLREVDGTSKISIEEIDDKALSKAIVEKKDNIETSTTQSATNANVNKNIVEVDLHIDRLLDDTTGMNNGDILEHQLNVFRETLQKYKLRTGQKIVFIHGKGDGVLRQRILWELQTKYKRFNHQDASFKQYGYGATMVTIK